jgi:hypothetical protein
MVMIYVTPAKGGRVRQPERQSRVMPEAGAFVPRNAHYERLLQTGDVTLTDAPKPAADTDQSKSRNPSSGRTRRDAAASED